VQIALVEAQIIPAASTATPKELHGKADDFIAAARSADTPRLLGLFSPVIMERVGAQQVERYLSNDVRSFFSYFHKVAGSVTVTPVNDAHGIGPVPGLVGNRWWRNLRLVQRANTAGRSRLRRSRHDKVYHDFRCGRHVHRSDRRHS
jgi:hypothetical protein